MVRIKKVEIEDKISKNKLDSVNYPVFCFKHLQENSLKDCKDVDFLIKFLFRLKSLCQLGWKEIKTSPKHSFGTEQLNISQIKPTNKPSILTPDVKKLTVFRATGDNHAVLGIIKEPIFHVIYIETVFGDIYDH